jgi:6-pyruvoyltetrahydropterin/6-carboxytetrahydropterin synthase
MYTCQKVYTDIPFAHRQHNHDGHCAQIHGHNWSFGFSFSATKLDKNGFVVDFGELGWIKEWLDATFDHRLVLNTDDPALVHFIKYIDEQLASIVLVPNCGAEGLAKFTFDRITAMCLLPEGVHLIAVRVEEDSKNSATYTDLPKLVEIVHPKI